MVNKQIVVEDQQMGSLVKKAIVQASIEKRLIVGLSQIVRCLAQDQVDSPIMCMMAQPKAGDYATHMQEVLLKAYCLENDIYIIQLDSPEKLNRILKTSRLESCALICANPAGDSNCEGSFLDQDYQLTKYEKQLINHCEDHWDDFEAAVIRLPEK